MRAYLLVGCQVGDVASLPVGLCNVEEACAPGEAILGVAFDLNQALTARIQTLDEEPDYFLSIRSYGVEALEKLLSGKRFFRVFISSSGDVLRIEDDYEGVYMLDPVKENTEGGELQIVVLASDKEQAAEIALERRVQHLRSKEA